MNILIVGKNSFVGTSFIKFLKENHNEQYIIDEISVKDDSWKIIDFSKYNVVFHVAGIAHVSTDPKMEDMYYKVNRDLTIEVAKKAKKDNVDQFIFMSSMIVFGKQDNGIVTLKSIPNPENFYGKSKLEAEEALRELESNKFKVSILRPPMIYGAGSKGNYPKLAKLAKLTPIFPNYPNKRSMLFIDNLSIFIKSIIDNNASGTFHPQNQEYVVTSTLVKEIAKTHKHKILFVKIFNPLLTQLKKIEIVNKIFGDLYYEDKKDAINDVSFEESIAKTQMESIS